MRLVAVIALCWTLFACISFISEYFFVNNLVKLKKLSGNYNFWLDFSGTVFLGIFGGLAGGYLLVFKMNMQYRRRSFAFGIINSGLLFIISYLGLAVAGLFIMDIIYFTTKMNFVPAFNKTWENILFNIKTPSFLFTLGIWAFLVSFTQFMLQVSDKFGPGVLWKFITGKYYHPRQEKRIFMFLDLKSSTTIAEKIGSQKFFELLKEIYNDITEPVLNSQGEIYQYVGDEVVITWPVERGLNENNCLACFFGIEETLKDKEDYYLRKFGTLPSFKAGLHIGEATVGEIGVIKKDIVFSGDVMNTTSRIQKQCNNYKVNILMSAELLAEMKLNDEYREIALGEILLRGKEETVMLYSIAWRQNWRPFHRSARVAAGVISI
jgi:adenylate cyclase